LSFFFKFCLELSHDRTHLRAHARALTMPAPPPLYAWQADAIALGRRARALVYTAPTGGGKSRVADELLFDALRQRGPTSTALVILPYVALVREKVASLTELARVYDCGVRVKGFAGPESDGAPLRGRERVAVVTIEKASSCAHRMLESGDLDCVCMVVVDELHMVGIDARGAALESVLAKIRHAVVSGRTPSGGPKIVAMTATASAQTLSRLAKWLDAELYVSNTRAVELREYVVCRHSGVYVKRGCELERVSDAPNGTEADVCEQLVGEVFIQNHSSLVFCSSKAACEDLARRMAQAFIANASASARGMRDASAEHLFAAAEGAPNPALVFCVRAGVAWHHAGLTTAEKSVIEQGFRSGAILALCCTSTLAAGVNLPARRVVIRPDDRNLSMAQYRQMSGRAGRKGHSDVGESFFLTSSKNNPAQGFSRAKEWVCGELPPLESQLFPAPRGVACDARASTIESTQEQRRFFLDGVACGAIRSHKDTFSLIMNTFAWTSEVDAHRDDILRLKDESLKAIHSQGLARVIRRNDSDATEWDVSPEGYSFYKCTLPVAHARELRLELEHAISNGVKLSTKTHLLFFCVAPVEGNIFARRLDWRRWFDALDNDEALREFAEKHLAVTQSFARKMQIAPAIREDAVAQMTRHERLAAALLLADLLRAEETISDVRARWLPFCDNLTTGDIQRLQTSAASTAGMASVLCEQCNWISLAELLSTMSLELQAGARRELLPLMSIDGMTGARARTLYDSGFTTPRRIVELGADKMDRLNAAVLKSLAKSSKSSVGFDQAARSAAWRIAQHIFSNARRLVATDAQGDKENVLESIEKSNIVAA
jgi:replicative superfamily II helicase